MSRRIRMQLILVAALATLLSSPVLAQSGMNALPVRAGEDGPRVSLDVQDAEIGTVLRSLASYSGTNIVASPRVTGKVTVKLDEVPWLEALRVILRAHGFDFIEENGVLRVDTAAELRQEKIAVKMADKQVDDLEKLILGLSPLKYANASEVKKSLEQMLTDRGNIDIDVRTNSLLINDIASRVTIIQDMAKRLDTTTPQVEINAKLVDLDSRAMRELGVSWSAANFQPDGVNMAGNLSVTNKLQETSGDFRIGTVQNFGDLMLQVQALEKDNRARLISNPVITTTDNREASILVGQKIPLIVADEAGNAVTQLTTIGILLRVTPHINEQDRITLDIHNEVSDLSSQATVQGGVIINTSESDTRVMVEHGQTAIIAGLIRQVESTLTSGVPVLQDIPLLGALFRHQTKSNDARELVIFVTPRIVDTTYLSRSKLTEDGDIGREGATYTFDR
jgi:type IV pilus assembly protein PilQ